MSYIPEDKIYIYVSPENKPPLFPVGIEKLDVSVTPIGEGMVQVVGLPKTMKNSQGAGRIKSLELASKIKDRGFVLAISSLDGASLLVLVKNSAVWLSRVVSKEEIEKEIQKIANFVWQKYNQRIERVLAEKVEVKNPNKGVISEADRPRKTLLNRNLIIVSLVGLIFLIVGSLLFYLS